MSLSNELWKNFRLIENGKILFFSFLLFLFKIFNEIERHMSLIGYSLDVNKQMVIYALAVPLSILNLERSSASDVIEWFKKVSSPWALGVSE